MPQIRTEAGRAVRGVASRLRRRSPLTTVFPTRYAKLVRRLRPGSLAVDCGANVGNVTAALASTGLDVVAFEPHPDAFAELERRFAGTLSVTCLRQAVGAGAGTRRLHLHPPGDATPLDVSAGASLFGGKRNVDARSWIPVETIGLPSFLDGLDRRISLLKLDVEGAEVEILERMLESDMLERIELVLVEMHDWVVPELEERGAALRERLADERYDHVHLDWL